MIHSELSLVIHLRHPGILEETQTCLLLSIFLTNLLYSSFLLNYPFLYYTHACISTWVIIDTLP